MLRSEGLPVILDPAYETLTDALDAVPLEQLASIPAPTDQASYERLTLHRDEEMELAAARWCTGGQSSLHGHEASAAVYTVISGLIEEEHYLPDGDSYRCEIVILRPGDRVQLPPGAFHRVRALEESVTLHGYTPPCDSSRAPVPPELNAILQQARSRVEASPSQEPKTPRAAVHPRSPDLVAVVRDLLDGWARREAQANDAGMLHMPPETVAEMKSSGILAAPVPLPLGGWDSSLEETATAIRLIAQRAPATALALVMPLGNAATTRIPQACVPPAVRPALVRGQRWIAEQVRRGRILAVANSEPGAGGELSSTKTMAHRGSDGVYRLTGRKSFATFGRDADYFLCAARRMETVSAEQAGVVDGFFVARDAAGLVVDDRWNPVGMRPTASVGLTLDAAPADAILGFPGCLEGVNARHWSTVLFAAVFLGVAEGALREAVQMTPGDAVWARSTLAEHALNLDAAGGFVESVARDERWPLPAEAQERARRAKTFVARVAVETATKAAMISGGRSYTPGHPVFRFLCDALAGPLLRPPMPQAMDTIVRRLFPAQVKAVAK
jgi:alkylation response protein AidB-like acyl-CoA dehydrogenase